MADWDEAISRIQGPQVEELLATYPESRPPDPTGQNLAASWYGPGFNGRPTATGERFNQNALSAASRTLPLNSYAEVTNPANNEHVTVRINDRGPYFKNSERGEGRQMDLSRGAAIALGTEKQGVAHLRVRSYDPRVGYDQWGNPMSVAPPERPVQAPPWQMAQTPGYPSAAFLEPEAKQTTGTLESFLEGYVDPWLLPAGRHPRVLQAIPVLAAGAVGGPLASMAAAALTEPSAQTAESDFYGQPKSIRRGMLNVGFSALGGASKYVPVSPLLKLGVPLIEQTGISELYQASDALSQGRLPDWDAVSAAGSDPMNLVALPFGGIEYAHAKALQRVHARRAQLPHEIVRAHTESGGSTFDLEGNSLTGKPGYAVSLYPERSLVHEGTLTPEVVQDYVRQHRDLLDSDPRNSVGTWWDKESGKNYLDVSAVEPSREDAIALGKKYNQKAIFDLERMEEIPIGGTGEPIEGLPPERERLGPPRGGYFSDIATAAQSARDWMATTYKRAGLADETGAIQLSGLDEPSGVRAKALKTIVPSEQNVRANLSRLAADRILSPGTVDFATWSGEMLEKYGAQVGTHLKPAWAQANTALNARTRHLLGELPNTARTMELLQAGRNGEDWYGPMRRELTKVFGQDTDTFIRMLAATSPRANIERNLQLALKSYVQWKAGATEAHPDVIEAARVKRQNSVHAHVGKPLLPEPTIDAAIQGFRGGLFPEDVAKAARGETFGGPKVRNFLAAMQGDKNAVVIDVWMQRYLGYKEAPNPRTGELEMPSMTDLEYALNADWIRTQAEQHKMAPAEFQERVWRGIKGTWRDARSHDTAEPYQVVLKERARHGLPIFDEATLRSLNRHEEPIAQAIEAEMAASGRAHPSASGLPTPHEGFDWSTGEVVKKKTAAVRRKGQSGSVRLDALLPTWVMLKVGQGVRSFGHLLSDGVKRFGEGVRELMPRAWTEGRKRALTMAESSGERVPPEVKVFSEGHMPEADTTRERQSFTRKYGKGGALMADLLDRHAGEIEEARRGTINQTEVQRLADQIKGDLVDLVHKHQPGTAATAEEIKRIADLTYTLDKRLAEKYKLKTQLETEGKWSEADAGELAELESNFVNLHAVRRGTSAEAGRALAAHQITKRLRNRDLNALLSYARARGLPSDEVQRVFAQHKDPVSRAQAIQTMSGLSASGLYTHARYWTMLSDPATWINAGFGNVVDGLVREAGKVPVALGSKLFNRGNRWVTARDFNPRAAGSIRGIAKGVRRWFEIMGQGTSAESIAAGKAPPMELFGERPVVGLLANLPFRALSASDALATTMFGEAELNGFAYARAMKSARDRSLTGSAAEDFAREQAAAWVSAPPEWLLQHVDRVTRQLSLQSPLGKTMVKVESALRDYPAASSFVLAFLKTGVNALKQAGKKTPAGLVYAHQLERAAATPESARNLAKRRGILVRDVAAMETSAGGHGSFQDSLRREAALTRGEAAVGTALIAAVPLLIHAGLGNITGDPPQDQAERERMAKERPFNAVQIGNLWMDQKSFGTLEPMLRLIGNAKQSHDIIKRRKTEGVDESQQRMIEGVAAGLKGLAQAGPLSHLDSFLSLFDGDSRTIEGKAGRLFKDLLIIPTAAEKYQKYTDPYQRRVETFLDPLRAAFRPGDLAPRLDPLGDPIRKRPLPIVKQWGDNVDERLNEAAKAGVSITSPDIKTLNIPGQGDLKLELRDRRVLNRAMGLATRKALSDALGDRASWEAMDPDARKMLLNTYKSTYRSAVQKTAMDQKLQGRQLNIGDLVAAFGGG